MWGNLLGWVLSILLVAATVGGIHFAKGFDRPTPASAFADQVVAAGVLAPPIPARHLLPDLSGTGDSTQAVRRAIDAYRADRWTYDRAASGNVPDNFDTLPAVIAIIDAAMSKNEAVLAPFAEQVVTFRTNKPELEAVWVLGEGLVRAALKKEESDPETAVGYYNAALALGAKMSRERLVYAELSSGLTLMIESSQRLAKLTRNQRRTDALRNFVASEREFFETKVSPVWKVIGSVDPSVGNAHAGDLFTIARSSPERMWRVEAVLAIGRCQFSGPRRADIGLAKRTLKEMSENDPDPIVRQAAKAAASMKIEDFRMLH